MVNGRRTSGRFLAAAVAAVVSMTAGVTAPQAAAGTGAPDERSAARLATMTEAPDTATALAAAHLQQRTVPIAALTTPTRRVSAKPDGTMQAELSPVPAWVKQGNGWANADPTMRRQADHTVAPAVTQLPMRLSGGGSTPLATIGTPGRSFALSWPGVLPEPVLDGTKSTYPEVLPGVDLVLISDVGQLSQHLVVKTAAAARNPALRSIHLGLHLDGLTVRAAASGALQAVDKAGAVAFEAPPSTMWDAKGRPAKVGVAVDSGTVTLTPDRQLLTDPHAAFPITVDPAWRTPDWEWAKVFSGKGDTSYWWGGQDIEPDTGANWGKVGYCGFTGCNNIGTARTYFQFDTSFMNGKTLISAVFSAAIAYSPDCTHTPLHELWIGNTVVNGGLTWNNQPGATRIGSAVAGNEYPGCANGYQSIKFDIGGYYSPTNRSVYSIRAANEGDKNAWRKYDVSKTRLRFDYNSTPAAATGLKTDPVLPAPCKWCGGIPYLHDQSIRLISTLSDPDNDQLNPDWDVFSRKPADSDTTGDVVNERGPALASGATFSRTLDLTGLDGKQLWWKVRGWDGLAGGPRVTSDKTFAVDRSGIATLPGVVGDLYTTDDNSWHGGVGVPGKFTFTPFTGGGTSPADVKDIDHYVYDWHDNPQKPVDADALGGSAVLFVAPEKDGPQTLYVRSVDRAGNLSPTFQYHTYVRAGSGPVAHWPLNGDPSDTSALRGHDGTLNGATSFTAGADGQALTLSGSGSLSAPKAVRTDLSFSVSAWVRIAARPAGATGVQTAVSADGAVNSGFMLNYRNDPTGDRWEFHLPSADQVARNADTVLRSTGFARPGEWAHLAAVYDVVTRKVLLYVNGEPAGSMVRTDGFDAGGAVELGRALWEGNAVNAWNGSVDDVQVFDRALSPSDVQSIVRQADVAVDHFTFDDTGSGSTVQNSVAGGAAGTLHGGAQLADHGAVHKALTMGSAGDYLSAPNAVRTNSSFAVSAWVRVAARPAGDTGVVTALSQDGSSYSGFMLSYRNDPGGDRWEFLLPCADAAQRSSDTVLRSSVPARVGVWTHLTGVYDAPTNKVLLYVNGVLAGSMTRLGGFTATGEFKVGRGLWDGNDAVNPWNGSVDEVRAYSRTLSDAEIQSIVSRDDVTVGKWQLDGNLQDASPRNVTAVPDGAVGYTTGQVSVPNPNDKALALTGTAQSTVSTPHAVDTDQSFSVAAWARVDQVGGNQTVASQDGTNVSGFRLRQCGDRWCFVMFPKDIATSVGAVEAQSGVGSAQAGKWTHVVAVYDAAAKKILIYIDGVAAGSAAYTSTWNSGGSFHIGAAGPGLGEFLTGAIDDVAVYSRALTAAEIPALSGRDVSLVHKYTFEEGTGSTTADAAGGRPATLNPGATFTSQGQIGGALNLDGSSGSATTTGVDLRTDQTFTVSAWVYLSSKPCDLSDPANVCKADAVTIDGSKTSKFRLGHVIDGDNHADGAWVFEMPESDAVDAKVTKAAVSTLSSELDRWTLLTGVYDPAQKQLWIYVDGTRVGAGVLLNAWPSTGPLVIGRGKAAGTPAEFWPGRVDDVLLYNVAMDTDQVSALRDSYPK